MVWTRREPCRLHPDAECASRRGGGTQPVSGCTGRCYWLAGARCEGFRELSGLCGANAMTTHHVGALAPLRPRLSPEGGFKRPTLRCRTGAGAGELIASPLGWRRSGCRRTGGARRTVVTEAGWFRGAGERNNAGGESRGQQRGVDGVMEGGGALMDGQRAHAHAVGTGDVASSLAGSYRTTLAALRRLNPGIPHMSPRV